MRRLLIVAIVALIGALPMTASAQPAPATQVKLSETAYPYAVGFGAIAGIVGTQYILFGSAGFPFFAGSVPAGSAIPAVVSVGVSRMFAITSAVAGGLIGLWLHDH